jgi:hypothetical protein
MRLGRMILVACALFALASAAHASPIFIFDTGVDLFGVPLANGMIGDPHYVLISVPAGSAAIQVRTSAGGFPINGPWLGDDSLSAWIRPNNPGPPNDPVGVYDFRTTFDLTGLNPATAVVIGQWATDNEGLNILINGTPTGFTAAGFSSWSSFTLSSGFIAGANTLDFIVNNFSGDTGNPTGLRVEMSGTANEIPEPVSFVLLGAGLGALGLLRRRKV